MRKFLMALLTLSLIGMTSVYAESTGATVTNDGTATVQPPEMIPPNGGNFPPMMGSGGVMRPPFRPMMGSGAMMKPDMAFPKCFPGQNGGSGAVSAIGNCRPPMVGSGGVMRPPFKPMMGSGSMIGSGTMMKDYIKKMREKAQQDMKANRDKIKANLDQFKQENNGALKALSGSLTADQKASLKTLEESFKTEMQGLMDELKAAKGDDTKTKEIFAKIEAARAAHFDQIKAIVGDNADILKIVDQRAQVFEQNKTLRADNMATREQLKTGIADKVAQYKGLLIQKIGNKLDKLSQDQIQKLIDAVNAKITQVEANTVLSDDNKAKLKAQLVALGDMLAQKLDTSNSQDTVTAIQSMIDGLTQ